MDHPLSVTATPAHPALTPLRDLRGRATGPQRASVIICEGAEAVRWLLTSTLIVRCVVGKTTMLQALATELATTVAVPVFTAETDALSDLLGFRFERGVIATADRPELPPATASDDLGGPAARWLLLDAIHDHTNCGTLIRSARCLGLNGLVLGPGCADPYYRRAIRASVGHVFHLPLRRTADPAGLLTTCRRAGMTALALHRGPASIPLETCPLPTSGWLLVLGNEDRGVHPTTVAACDHLVEIPLAPGTDSLNVAAAGAIALHWFGRHTGR